MQQKLPLARAFGKTKKQEELVVAQALAKEPKLALRISGAYFVPSLGTVRVHLPLASN